MPFSMATQGNLSFKSLIATLIGLDFGTLDNTKSDQAAGVSYSDLQPAHRIFFDAS